MYKYIEVIRRKCSIEICCTTVLKHAMTICSQVNINIQVGGGGAAVVAQAETVIN